MTKKTKYVYVFSRRSSIISAVPLSFHDCYLDFYMKNSYMQFMSRQFREKSLVKEAWIKTYRLEALSM